MALRKFGLSDMRDQQERVREDAFSSDHKYMMVTYRNAAGVVTNYAKVSCEGHVEEVGKDTSDSRSMEMHANLLSALDSLIFQFTLALSFYLSLSHTNTHTHTHTHAHTHTLYIYIYMYIHL